MDWAKARGDKEMNNAATSDRRNRVRWWASLPARSGSAVELRSAAVPTWTKLDIAL
jgi:hypothetical protein